MIIGWRGIVPFSTGPLTTQSSSLFIQTAKKTFQSDSINGGIHTDPHRTFYHPQYSKDSQLSTLCKKVGFQKNLQL